MLKYLARIGKWMKGHDVHQNTVHHLSIAVMDADEMNSPENPHDALEDTLPEIDGSVSYLNGRFNITDPLGVGVYSSLVIPDKLRDYVLIDGRKPTRKTMILTSTSQIKFEIPVIPPATELSFTVSEDRLSVAMAVNLKHGARFTVCPFESTTRAVIRTDKIVDPAASLSFEELKRRLEIQEFTGRVDEQALHELAEATETMERIVLRSKPAIPGTPPILKQAPLPKGYDPVGRVRPLMTIKAGAVVGYIEDGTPSTPGIDVYGNLIRAPEATEMLPTLGLGVTRIHNNLIAIRPGRVLFTTGLVDVIPQLVLYKDVIPKDGYISFEGDVVIYGSVQDGSQVRASGNVIVHGGVFGSTVVGEQGVEAHGSCVKAKIWAGWAEVLYKDVLPLVQSLLTVLDVFEQDLSRVIQHIDATETASDKKALVAGVLIDQYHTELLPMLGQLVTHYKSTSLHQVAAQLERIVKTIQSHWSGVQYRNLTMPDVEGLVILLQKYRTHIETTISNDAANVTVQSVTSSTIHCTGDIKVTGFGVYSSILQSGNAIRVQGLVRGGFLTAERLIKIQELGSEAGTETSAKVIDDHGKIEVALRHPNTILVIDGKRERNLLTQKHVRFEVDLNHDDKSFAR